MRKILFQSTPKYLKNRNYTDWWYWGCIHMYVYIYVYIYIYIYIYILQIMVEKIISIVFIFSAYSLFLLWDSSVQWVKIQETKNQNIYNMCQTIFFVKLFLICFMEKTFLSIVPIMPSTPGLPKRNSMPHMLLFPFPLFCFYAFTPSGLLPLFFLLPFPLLMSCVYCAQ